METIAYTVAVNSNGIIKTMVGNRPHDLAGKIRQ